MAARVQDYMTGRVVTVAPTDTLSRARNLMIERGIKRLVVVGGDGRIEGMLTTADIIKPLSGGRAPWRWRLMENSLIARYMTPGPATISPDASVKEAARIMMEKGVSGLPVARRGELVGIITKTDLVRYFAENVRGKFKVEDLMTKDVIAIGKGESIKKAARMMAERGIKRLVVLDPRRRILGMVTETDLAYVEGIRSDQRLVIDSLAGRQVRQAKAKMVSEIMRSPVVTTEPGDDSSKAAKMMIEFGFSGFPVSSDGERLEGIITKTDIIRGILLALERDLG